MVKRRDFLKVGLAVGGSSLIASKSALAQEKSWLKYLCPPDDRARELDEQPPSPPAAPFVTPLYYPPDMRPSSVFEGGKWRPEFHPPPDPKAHQRYQEFHPKKLYEIHEVEFRWQFHRDEPYSKNGGSWAWGWKAANTNKKYR